VMLVINVMTAASTVRQACSQLPGCRTSLPFVHYQEYSVWWQRHKGCKQFV